MRIADGRVVAYSRAKRLDLVRAQAGGRGRPRGRPLARALAQLRVPQAVALEPVAVLEAVAEDHVHHPERERRVRAGIERDVLVGLLGRPRAVGVDRHEPRAAPARLLDERPQVHVRAHDVAAPGDDQPGLRDRLGVVAHGLAAGGLVAVAARARADRAVEQARPERVEEAAVHAGVAEQAHVAGVRVGQDRLRPVRRGDLAQPRRPRDRAPRPSEMRSKRPSPLRPTRRIG